MHNTHSATSLCCSPDTAFRVDALHLLYQLLYLASEDPTKDITLYINSPGGSVSAGMAIYDTMQVSHLKKNMQTAQV